MRTDIRVVEKHGVFYEDRSDSRRQTKKDARDRALRYQLGKGCTEASENVKK